jgi:hypothetical protein
LNTRFLIKPTIADKIETAHARWAVSKLLLSDVLGGRLSPTNPAASAKTIRGVDDAVNTRTG